MTIPTTNRLDAVARLDRAADRLAQMGDEGCMTVAADIRLWLAGQVANLDEALGVAPGPCERDPRRVLSLRRRDEAVRLAVKAWGSVDALAEALARYRASSWRFDRIGREVPARLLGLREELLFRILRERDCSLSRSMIYRIVARAP